MKTVLWFSNCMQSNGKNKDSGSWLFSMAQLLVSTRKIHLINITTIRGKSINNIEHHFINEYFDEYLLPVWPLDKNGIPSAENCSKIKDLCIECSPNIIHVWGVENYYSKIVPLLNLNIPTLLEIQGIRSTCAEVYYGDLSIRETLQCFGLREILFPFMKSIYKEKSIMRSQGNSDDEVIRLYKHISTQSGWIRDHIRAINSKTTIYKTSISIREEFWKADKWVYNNKDFYCSAGGPFPYKSIQTAIRALSVVVREYPETKLYVIGNFLDSTCFHQSGYLTFIKNLTKKLNLVDNVIFTGPLFANEIIDIMHKCVGMVQTSYVESYSLAVAEAMCVGIPSIISYAGAMPELAQNRISGLFYTPGDYIACASRMIELIENRILAEFISDNARKLAFERNNDESVLNAQINIYKQLIEDII